jgi:hypothetical protein
MQQRNTFCANQEQLTGNFYNTIVTYREPCNSMSCAQTSHTWGNHYHYYYYLKAEKY